MPFWIDVWPEVLISTQKIRALSTASSQKKLNLQLWSASTVWGLVYSTSCIPSVRILQWVTCVFRNDCTADWRFSVRSRRYLLGRSTIWEWIRAQCHHAIMRWMCNINKVSLHEGIVHISDKNKPDFKLNFNNKNAALQWQANDQYTP